MDNTSMTYKEIVDEYNLQITKKNARIRELEEQLAGRIIKTSNMEIARLRKALEEIQNITSAEGVKGLALKCHIIAGNALPDEVPPETPEALKEER